MKKTRLFLFLTVLTVYLLSSISVFANVIEINESSDYVEGEVIYLAETEEDAILAAEKFGGSVKYYSYGVATISLPDDITTAAAFKMSQENKGQMPEVWPNYVDKLDEIKPEPYQMEEAGNFYQWFHSYLGTEYAFVNDIKGDGVNIAVLDTGIRESHVDISGNTLPGRDFYKGANGTPFSGDPKGHGTHVAGIINANASNGFLGAGIAPGAKVASFRVASPTGSVAQDDAIRAIYAAIEDGSYKIINISIGGYGYNGAYKKACQDAYEHGIAIFASAGNDGISSAHYPSSYDHVMGSGAVDKTGATMFYSNYGKEVDFFMPGYRISSLNYTDDTSYRISNGTSMSSPMAAGVAALILSDNSDLLNDHTSASVDTLIQIMKSSVPKESSNGIKTDESIIRNALLLNAKIKTPEVIINSVDGDSTVSKEMPIKGREIDVTLKASGLSDVSIYYTLNGKTPDAGATLYKGSSMIIYCNEAKKVTLKAIAINDVTGEKSNVLTRVFTFDPPLGSIYIREKNGLDTVKQGGKLTLSAFTKYENTAASAISKKINKANTDKNIVLISTVKNGTWSSSSDYIRVSNKGVVSVNKKTPAGAYEISFTGNNGKKATYIINVVANSGAVKVTALKNIELFLKNEGDEVTPYNILNDIKITDKDGNVVKCSLRLVSSNDRVVRVSDNGMIVPVSKGTAKIKATVNDGSNKSVIIKVSVKQLVTGVNINGPSVISAGKSVKLDIKVTPGDATNKKIDFKCLESDSDVKIKGNKLIASKNVSGQYTIVATPKDGGSGLSEPVQYKVTVKNGIITSVSDTDENRYITLYVDSYQYNRNEFYKKYPVACELNTQITGSLDNNGDANKIESNRDIDKYINSIKFTSSNNSVATVDKYGKISANSVGKSTITIESTDGSNKKLTYLVNVIVPMSSLKITAASYSSYMYQDIIYLSKGGRIKLTAAYESSYGTPTDKRIIWKSNNKNIKVNSKGELLASKYVKVGDEASITVSGYTDKKVTSTITVIISEKCENGGIISTDITSNGERKKVYFAVNDINKAVLSKEFLPINMCSYEAEGDGIFTISKYKDDKTGITGYIPFAGERTTTYTYDEWMSIYESLGDNNRKKEEFYKRTGKKMKIVARMQEGSGTAYYKEFYVFRIPITYDEASKDYYKDKTLYVELNSGATH